MTCIIDSCKIIPYSKSESTTTTSSTHISSDSYYTDETDSCQSQRDISAKTKIMQNRRRKQCKKDKVTVPCGSFILSVDVSDLPSISQSYHSAISLLLRA